MFTRARTHTRAHTHRRVQEQVTCTPFRLLPSPHSSSLLGTIRLLTLLEFGVRSACLLLCFDLRSQRRHPLGCDLSLVIAGGFLMVAAFLTCVFKDNCSFFKQGFSGPARRAGPSPEPRGLGSERPGLFLGNYWLGSDPLLVSRWPPSLPPFSGLWHRGAWGRPLCPCPPGGAMQPLSWGRPTPSTRPTLSPTLLIHLSTASGPPMDTSPS